MEPCIPPLYKVNSHSLVVAQTRAAWSAKSPPPGSSSTHRRQRGTGQFLRRRRTCHRRRAVLGVGGLAVDSSGNLYIADTLSGRVRMVSPNGIITTVAGNGVRYGDGTFGAIYGYSGDGGRLPAHSLIPPAWPSTVRATFTSRTRRTTQYACFSPWSFNVVGKPVKELAREAAANPLDGLSGISRIDAACAPPGRCPRLVAKGGAGLEALSPVGLWVTDRRLHFRAAFARSVRETGRNSSECSRR